MEQGTKRFSLIRLVATATGTTGSTQLLVDAKCNPWDQPTGSDHIPPSTRIAGHGGVPTLPDEGSGSAG
jgi:hypothetical protein